MSLLACPYCEATCDMHHCAVAVFERPGGEDGDGKKTIHRGVHVKELAVPEKDMPGRRNAVTIQFNCFNCHRNADLRIQQHKGETHFDWLNCNAPVVLK